MITGTNNKKVRIIEKRKFFPLFFFEKVCEYFHKKFRRTVLVKDFTKNLDDIRLKNIFLDKYKNFCYNLNIIKERKKIYDYLF